MALKMLLASIFLLSINNVWGGVVKGGDLYKLNIIHYNDFHARFEETAVDSPICHFNNGSCLGGFPRLYHHIHTLLAKKPDALLLNAGDSFQGTFWYTLLKWNITQEFMNLLPHDAHAIGNHEFDDGPEGLAPYLRALKAPVLAANLDSSKEPSLQGTYQPSIVVERNGRKIGIIGLITVDTVIFSTTGNVVFTDPGEATKREAEALKKKGVDIIILLSHCGLDVDKQLARDYGQYIDVIVGGHTHSILWNGDAPSGEPVAGPYPVFIENSADKSHKVLIVQAASFTKYMGDLTIYFDQHGDYVKWEGGPIFLNRDIPEDLEIKKKLEPYVKFIHDAVRKPVGQSLVDLDSKECRAECPVGNLLVDAMVEYAKDHVDSSRHYLAFISVLDFMPYKINTGVITEEDVYKITPFNDRIFLFELSGEQIRHVLESSVTEPTAADWVLPTLKQVSGLQVTYNMSKPDWQRLTSVSIVNGKSTVPLENDKKYHVLTPKFFLYAPKGLTEIRKTIPSFQEIDRDITVLKSYIKKHSPIDIKTTGRIVMNH